jgi:hypothetical protein
VTWSELRKYDGIPARFVLIAEEDKGEWEVYERALEGPGWYRVHPDPGLLRKIEEELGRQAGTSAHGDNKSGAS